MTWGLSPLLYGNVVGTVGHNPQKKAPLPFDPQCTCYRPLPDTGAVLFGVEQVQEESAVFVVDVDNEIP